MDYFKRTPVLQNEAGKESGNDAAGDSAPQ